MTDHTDETVKYTNALIDESSPYLLQHAHNPVNWYPWGEVALEKARREDKPIFLSIGYAACHWCHVMEHESFEDEATAAILNEHFISIKVDREQRPDLDRIYMTATQALTGSGGWPMSVFLTPDLKPFFAGTYFPPEDGYGRPGFKNVLMQLIQVYKTEYARVEQMADRVSDALHQYGQTAGNGDRLHDGLIDEIAKSLQGGFDPVNGGFGNQPKFPHGAEFGFLVKYYAATRNEDILTMINRSLTKMAHGGIYDQIGGGFHRYSVDARWLVPHFEKMLYDNAILAATYAEAFQVTNNDLYRRVAKETLDFMLREMIDTAGGFYSSLDADSEGQEGKYYVWTKKEIEAALKDKAALFCKYFNITDVGNFEHGANIPNIDHFSREARQGYEGGQEQYDRIIAEGRDILFHLRNERIRPGTDDKILVSWNGLAIAGFCRGYQITGEEKYHKAAVGAARFIRKELYDDGRLRHSYRKGKISEGEFLEDYAYIIPALIDLYEITHDFDWIEFSCDLARRAVTEFADDTGWFYLAPDGQKDHFIRPSDVHDGAIPAPGSILIQGLIRLAGITGDKTFQKQAEKSLSALVPQIGQIPNAMVSAAQALFMIFAEKLEIVVVGKENREALEREINRFYHPNRVVIISDDGLENIPLLEGRTSSGPTVAYVCRNNACGAPARTVEELRARLDGK